MIQKHNVISMIAPITVVGILIMAILANQALAYSSYKGHHGYYKTSKYTRHGNVRASNTGNEAQGTSNTGTIQMKCTTGYIWLPSGGFRHCAFGKMVNAPQGSSSTSGGVQKSSNAAPQG